MSIEIVNLFNWLVLVLSITTAWLRIKSYFNKHKEGLDSRFAEIHKELRRIEQESRTGDDKLKEYFAEIKAMQTEIRYIREDLRRLLHYKMGE